MLFVWVDIVCTVLSGTPIHPSTDRPPPSLLPSPPPNTSTHSHSSIHPSPLTSSHSNTCHPLERVRGVLPRLLVLPLRHVPDAPRVNAHQAGPGPGVYCCHEAAHTRIKKNVSLFWMSVRGRAWPNSLCHIHRCWMSWLYVLSRSHTHTFIYVHLKNQKKN